MHHPLMTILSIVFVYHNTAATDIYTLSLHDALPISITVQARLQTADRSLEEAAQDLGASPARAFIDITLPIIAPAIVSDRKSTRLNSSHLGISYAVFCLKKKNEDRIKNLEKITEAYT